MNRQVTGAYNSEQVFSGACSLVQIPHPPKEWCFPPMGSGGSISPRPEATDIVTPVLAADDSVDPCKSIPTSPTEGVAVRPSSSGSGLRRADQVVLDEAPHSVAPVLAADDSVDPCKSIPTSPTEGVAVRPTSSGSGLRRADQVVLDEAPHSVAPVLAADDSVDPCKSIPTSPTEGVAVRPTSSGSGLRRADQVVMDAHAKVPENLVVNSVERRSSKKVSSLREYFVHDYKYGGMFQHDGYRASNSWCFEDKKFGIKVWRDAIDLTEGAAGEVDCVFHYTSELGFRNITHTELQTAEIFASLVTAGKQANAWWGRGVYTVRKAPDEWQDIEALMDNNFRNMLRRDVEKLGREAALQLYKGRVAYCIPILASSSSLYDVSLRQNP